DEVLGLAGAYAVYAAGARDYLRVVVNNLARLPHAGLDVELLRITAEEPGQAPLSEEAKAALRPHAALGEVPLLRWGARRALELRDGADAEPPLGPWHSALAVVDRGLSPISTWTAWTE